MSSTHSKEQFGRDGSLPEMLWYFSSWPMTMMLDTRRSTVLGRPDNPGAAHRKPGVLAQAVSMWKSDTHPVRAASMIHSRIP